MSKKITKKVTKKTASAPKKVTNRASNKKVSSRKKTKLSGSSFVLSRSLKTKAKFWVLRIVIICLIASLASVAYLDIKIRQKFEGQKWALPAHVYARPMELYLGQQIDRTVLQQELIELGYQKREQATEVGTYRVNDSGIHIYQREFMFWDGLRPAQLVSIDFVGQRISDIRASGSRTEIIRLEPRLFGSVSPLRHEDRSLLTLDDTPQHLVNALLAIEDRQFYSHFGINPLGIIRAMMRNVMAGRVVQGGSTLTQQLVKTYYLNSERTVKRKITEMVMAILLELHYDKQQVLQAYLNEVHLSQVGNRAIHGFALGSQHFFGRPLQELDLSDLAMLAGIINGPSYFNPIRNPERATKRRNLVLKAMLDEAFIEQDEYVAAIDEPLHVGNRHATGSAKSYPSFLDMVRVNLENDYQQKDLLNDGLNIYTTLNPRLQTILEKSVRSELDTIEKSRSIKANTLQVAAVMIRTDNGEVAAMVGDRKPAYAGFNRALSGQRPVGSLIKPFVYLAALESPQRYHLASVLNDREITVKQNGSVDWNPRNYDGAEHGDVMLVDALARSYNLATVQLGMELGVQRVINTVHRVGYDKSIRPLPSILLGAVPMSVLDVAQMYLSIASGGFKTPIKSIRSVVSNTHEPLTRYPLSIEQVIEPEANALITYALQEVVRSGTARSILNRFQYDYGLAGKTGTTDDYRDSWFAGFSGNYLMVVWVGRDDNKSTGLSGASGAARVWSKAMSQADLQRIELNSTEDMTIQSVLSSSAKGQQICDKSRNMPFMLESLPLQNLPCDNAVYHRQVEFDYNESSQDSVKPAKRTKKSWWERLFE